MIFLNVLELKINSHFHSRVFFEENGTRSKNRFAELDDSDSISVNSFLLNLIHVYKELLLDRYSCDARA